MLGSYAPHPEGGCYTKNFAEEESPSGMLARSGTYSVKSRVVDDDGEIYAGKSSRQHTQTRDVLEGRRIKKVLVLTDPSDCPD